MTGTVNLNTIIVLVVVVVTNIFFGYWRSNARRFSGQWMMAIHIPVPIAIGLRLLFLGWNWFLLPVFVGAFAIGQFSGGRLRVMFEKQEIQLTSILMIDIFRAVSLKLRKKLLIQE